IVVLSPPGSTSPSSPSSSFGPRTSDASAPARASAFACASKSPWIARTPIRGRRAVAVTRRSPSPLLSRGGARPCPSPGAPRLPAAVREPLLLRERRHLDALHRLAEPAAGLE